MWREDKVCGVYRVVCIEGRIKCVEGGESVWCVYM